MSQLDPRRLEEPSRLSQYPEPSASASARTLTAQLMPLVHDLTKHRASIYWADFIISIGLFWSAYGLMLVQEIAWNMATAASMAVAVLGLYRATIFMHEIVHLPRGALPGFTWAWNLLCGIPLAMPSYLYASHIDHHSTRCYGTRQDPEYLPLRQRPLSNLASLVSGTLLSPAILWFRFAVLAPLAFLAPTLRRLIDARFSSVTLHPHYRADVQRLLRPLKTVRLLEALAMLYTWTVTGLLLLGVLPWRWAVLFIGIVLCVLLINMLRTLCAHRYGHNGEELSHGQQIADSVTLDWAGILLEFFAPLGLRYHALHHLFPYLPYHALGAAHRRLVDAGDIASAYRQTFYPAYREPRQGQMVRPEQQIQKQ